MKESGVEKKIVEVQDQWNSESLQFCTTNIRKPLLHPSGTAELMERLEDSIMILNSLNSNRASIPYKEGLQKLLKSLVTVEETMQLWLSTQSSWSHLEAVFSGGKIADQIPEAAERFSKLNAEYLKMIENARKDQAIVSICSSECMRDSFIWMSEELDVCQKSLADFLGRSL
jgi:dynein heavy chain